jgi:erythromycin esterase-like protein
MSRLASVVPPDVIRSAAHPLAGGARDYDPLLSLIGDARLVLLGEASHGTHEFYRERARITQRLVEEHGFTLVAVEADWPDAYRVNRWVRRTGPDTVAAEALGDFERFPRWMWRNREVLAFVSWLRDYNDARAPGRSAVGFYGLDLYSLFGSIEAVIDYLDQVDPEAARRARTRYECFDHFGDDPQTYGYSADLGLSPSCEREVVQQLLELQRRGLTPTGGSQEGLEDETFSAEQNARLVKNAEEYYRTMFRGRISSWNLRDRHMAETLQALLAHFDKGGGPTKAVVWEHNSHIGDARATSMGASGEWNVGQLTREQYGSEAVLVGFTTFTGTVTAAADWGDPAERKRVRPALPDSYEALLHTSADGPDFLLSLRDAETAAVLRRPRLERAIGVIYRPETERQSHYFEARLPDQFDAVVHFDETNAVEPLDLDSPWQRDDPPETFPSGL